MKVYAVAAWLLALGPSGASRRLRALLDALPAQLADDEAIAVLHHGAPPLPAGRGVRLHEVPIPARPSWRRVLAEHRVLPRALRAVGASLLHIESLPVPRAGVPVVLTVHDLRDLGPFRRRGARWFARVLRGSAARAAALVAPSRATASALQAFAPGREVAIVPGALPSDFAAAPPERSPWPGAFLHVGHLEPRKDLAMLLHAYALAGTRAELPLLVLAGRDAGEGGRLRALATQLGIADRVVLPGVLPESVLRACYAEAAALLLPSRCEGFGMPVLEALACGARVAVSDAGALPEVAGPAGRVVPAGDVPAWAEALCVLATHAPDEAARRAACARAAEFRADRAAATLLAVWRAVSARAAARPSR